MPVVPTYDSPQVSQQALPDARAQAPEISDIAGKQMQQFGEGMAGAGLGVRAVAMDMAEASVKEYDNQLSDAYRKIMYDPENGYLTRQGKNAVTDHDAVITALKDAKANMEKNMGPGIEQNLFSQIAERRLQAALGQVDSHASQQALVWKDGESIARIKNSTADATANWATWQQPGSQYSMAKGTLESEADEVARLRGYDTNQAQVFKREVLTGMHADVIGNMVSLGQASDAKRYIDAHVGEIAPDKLDTLQNIVKQGAVADESLNRSMVLKGSLSQQIAQNDADFKSGAISAEVHDATQTRLEHNYQLRKAQQGEYEKSLLGNAQDYLLKHPDATVEDLPPQMYAGLKNTGHLATIVAFSKNGRFDNDPRTWAEVVSNPSELAHMTPTEIFTKYRGRLDDAHLEKLYAMSAGAQGSGKPEHLDIIGTQERVKQAAQQIGILPYSGKPSDSQAQQFGRFQRAIDQRVAVFEASQLGGKRKASPDELQKLIDGVLLDKVSVAGTLWGSDDVYSFEVPAEQRDLIIGKLQKRRIPVTEQEIVNLWVLGGRRK